MSNKKVKGTLVGCDGNAFSLMGHFSKLAERQGWSSDEVKEVIDEATSGNYEHLKQTLNERMEAA